jgi:alpha-beta hydrolase superfamily lysophospholipase
VIDDLHEIGLEARKSFPGLPLFLFGHSLGSLLSQGYIRLYGEELAGCALSGTAGPMAPALALGGKLVAGVGAACKGRKAPAFLANKMSFGSFNDAFKPSRTAFDWLSRDQAEVDKYIADPLCGFVCSYGFFQDLLAGLAASQSETAMASIPKTLPIYMASGAKDPVGGGTGSVTALAKTYRALGIREVEDRLYPDCRHEILNETNRAEVTADFLLWFDRHCSRN